MRHADAVAARVTHRRRADVLDHREQHVAHLAFVLRRHHDDVRHAAQVSDVQQAVMRRAVAAGDAAAVQAELDVQILHADVVNDLIERALQESRVNRANRLQSFD